MRWKLDRPSGSVLRARTLIQEKQGDVMPSPFEVEAFDAAMQEHPCRDEDRREGQDVCEVGAEL